MIKANGIPLYIQAREALREQITTGELQPGQQLPSEDQLAVQFGISRMTLRRSLNELIEAGLLYSRHGVGTFVAQSRVQRDHTRLTDFFENCRLRGQEPTASLLFHEQIPADEKKASALGLNIGEPLIRLATLRSIDGVPITFHDAYLPQKLFPQLNTSDPAPLGLDTQHTWQLIESLGYNLANVVERLEAINADSFLTSLLGIPIGSPILYGERVAYADDGTPLKYADCYNRGDRFSLTIVLER